MSHPMDERAHVITSPEPRQTGFPQPGGEPSEMRYLLLLLCLLVAPVQAKPKPAAIKIVAPTSGYRCAIGSELQVMVALRPGLQVTSVVLLDKDGAGLAMSSEKPYALKWNSAQAKPGPLGLVAQVQLADGRSENSNVLWIQMEGQAAPTGATLQDGTPVLLANEEKLFSGETPEGSVVLYRVERDVLAADGRILVVKGAKAYGKVLKSSGSGFFGRAGELNIALESVTAADGSSVPLRSVRTSTGDDSLDVVIVGALLLSVFFIFIAGADVEIPPGTLATAYINRDTVIARPLPARLAPAELAAVRSVSLSVPEQAGVVQLEDKLVFSCTLTPPDDNAYLRIYLDDTLIAWQQGNLNKIEWDTNRNGKLREKILDNQEHLLFAEITYGTGQIVTSTPKKLRFKD